MGFFDKGFFRWRRAKDAPGRPAQADLPRGNPGSQFTQSTLFPASADGTAGAATASPHALRKDLLKLVLRETLKRNGIPAEWLGADLLRATSAQREPGIHMRLLVREWDLRLFAHGVALEQNLYKRLLAMDPTAEDWFMGISWQFALEDISRCPPLPHPGSWTSLAPVHAIVPAASELSTTGPAGDVIAGPVVIHPPQGNPKADLDRLLAERDVELARQRQGRAFDATQPVGLADRPRPAPGSP